MKNCISDQTTCMSGVMIFSMICERRLKKEEEEYKMYPIKPMITRLVL